MQAPRLLHEAPHWMTLETTMSYREVIVGGAIVGFFVVLSMAAEPWLGSDQSSVTDVIQLALTPVFLLTAVAALLNVFSTRLGRVADRVHQVSVNLQSSMTTDAHLLLKYLRRRSLVLDLAVVLATIAGMATSGAALILFVGALGEAVVRSMLFVLFGGAIFFTIAALFTFAIEMMMAG